MSLARAVRWAVGVLVGICLLAIVFGTLLGQPVGLAFVESGSMEPTLAPGDGFIAVPTPLAGEIDEGDVVTFRSVTDGGRLTTHRVVGETDAGFVTRGDANPFTDQADGEPPVPRDRIVAVALQVDGGVVVVPAVGAMVSGARGLLSTVGGTVGVGDDPTRLAVVVVVTLLSVLVLDSLLAAPGGRHTERETDRRDGTSVRRVLLQGIALVVVVATTVMLLSSGGATVPYDSVGPDEPSEGGLAAGSDGTLPVEVTNSGLVPAVAFLDAPGERGTIEDGVVRLGPRMSATVNVSVAVPSTPGRYEQSVVQHRYVWMLPVPVLRALHALHPWVAVAAVNTVLAFTLGLVGRFLVGRGRLRLRPGRDEPFDISIVRTLRRLYR
jgi:signal peptidase